MPLVSREIAPFSILRSRLQGDKRFPSNRTPPDAGPLAMGYHGAAKKACHLSSFPLLEEPAMKTRRWFVSLASLATVCCCLTAARAADNTPPEGFKALFNGKDLTVWKGLVGNPKTRPTMPKDELAKKQEEADKSAHEHWKVEDGVIVFDGKGQSLCTAKDYANFELFV